MSQPLAAVVFDWAGTMIDFGSRAPVEALLAAFASEGFPINEADARRDMGMAKRDHVAAILTHPPTAAAWIAAKGRPVTGGDLDRIYQAVELTMPAAAARHAILIRGAVEACADARARGAKIGSNTGYTRQMMAAIAPRAAEQGYAPDTIVCAGETATGRPSPLMLWKVLVELGAWPAQACVKVDDAAVGIAEGRAAGCWTVGITGSGNEVGLSAADYAALAPDDRSIRLSKAGKALKAAGADFLIPTIADLPDVLDQIEARLAQGGRPGTNDHQTDVHDLHNDPMTITDHLLAAGGLL
jgi:phosphonoacetaldehyde hydrolase